MIQSITKHKNPAIPSWVKLLCLIFFPVLSISFFPFVSEAWLLSRQLNLSLFTAIISLWILFSAPDEFKKSFLFSLKHPFALLIFALSAISFFQSFRSPEWLVNIGSSLKIFQWGLLFSCIYSLAQDKDIRNLILKSASIACSIWFLFAGIEIGQQIYFSNSNTFDITQLYQINSVFGHKNIFSISLFCALPLLILGIKHFNRAWGKINDFLIALSIILILFLQTRTVFVAAISGLVIVLLVLIFSSKSHKSTLARFLKKLSIRNVLGIAFLIFLGLTLWLTKLQTWDTSFFKRINGLTQWDQPTDHFNHTVKERLYLYSQSLGLIKEKPILGYGTGNWKLIFPSKGLTGYKAEQGSIYFVRPHNDFLWVWMELGLLGFVVFTLIFLVAVVKVIVNFYKNKWFGYHLLTLFTLIGFVVISFFDFPLERITPYTFIVCNLALCFPLYSEKQAENNNLKLAKIIFPFGIFMSICVLVIITKGFYHLKKMHDFHKLDSHKEVINQSFKAIDYKVPVDYFSTPAYYYIGEAYFYLGDVKKANDCFLKSEKIHPYHLLTLNNIGSTFYLLGQKEKAIDYYNRALSISSHFEEALINLSLHYSSIKKTTVALRYLSKINPKSNHPKLLIMRRALINNLLRKLEQQTIDETAKRFLLDNVDNDEWALKLHEHVYQENIHFIEAIINMLAK